MRSRLPLLVLAGLVLPGALAAQRQSYSIEVVVANGPHAGTYAVLPSQPCNHVADPQMGLSFSQLVESIYEERAAAAAKAMRDPKALNEVRMTVPEWDGKGMPRSGRIYLLFGPITKDGPQKGSTAYEIDTVGKRPDGRGTFKATDSSKLVSIEFEGETASGIKLRIKGACTNPVI
jgi:hypothetical protein